MWHQLWLLAICTMWGLESYAQNQVETVILDTRQFDITAGLSQNIITDIYQDQEGFIWIATYDGLNRFDGYDFQVYREQFLNNPKCLNNRIYQINEDKTGRLWIVKDEGSYALNPATDQIENMVLAEGELPARYINTISEGFSIASNRSSELLKIDMKTLTIDTLIVDFKTDESIGRFTSNKKVLSENKLIFLRNNGALIFYNVESEQYDIIPSPIKENAEFVGIITDHKERIWISSRTGHFFCYDPTSQTFEDYNSLGFTNIQELYFDKVNRSIWLSTLNEGLFQFNIEKKSWVHNQLMIAGKVQNNIYILSIIRDENNVMWFGTQQHGILAFDPYLKKFKDINPSTFNYDEEIRFPRKIESDQYGNIWIGSNNSGLWCFNQSKNSLELYTSDTHPNTINANSSIDILADQNRLYVGHNGKGLSIIDIPTKRLIERKSLVSTHPDAPDVNTISSLFKDKLERLWIGTRSSGVYRIEGAKEDHFHWHNTSFPINDRVSDIFQLDKGELIISTRLTGLLQWSEAKQNFEKVYPKSTEETLSIKSVFIDSKSNLWVSTDGKGIRILNQQFEELGLFNTKQGFLGSDVTCSFLEDKDENIWLGSNNGLSKLAFDAKTKTFSEKHFTMDDGLLSNEFMTGAVDSFGGQLWIGNINGINYFEPSELINNLSPPKVYIKQIQSFGKTLDLDTNLYYKDELELVAGSSALSFEFNTLGFSVPQSTKYMYRLKGLANTWSEANSRTFTSFTNLDPGHYVFEVKASNYDGVWTRKPAQLPIYIKPKLVETVLFKFILGLALLSLAIWYYRFRIERIREKERLSVLHQSELSKMEMKALRAQINPHFLFNTLNSINNYILRNDTENASKYLVKFSQLMRNILSNSITPFIPLVDELKALDLYINMESMRFNRSFDYFLNVDQALDVDLLKIPSMLLQPFVENAIWHGLMHKDGDKILEINIKPYSSTQICISVKDNGIGRKAASVMEAPDSKRKSYGIGITQKRIELINATVDQNKVNSKIEMKDLIAADGTSLGTEVIIYIPKVVSHEKVESYVA